MCKILQFDRAARVHDDLTYDQVLRRCRIASVTSGCTNAQRAEIETLAKQLLSTGLHCSHDVIQHCRARAESLAASAPVISA